MSALLQDLRYALRTLTKRPLHALVTAIVLALAIGANTTVFSVFDGFFLRPLPYPHGDRLVSVYNTYPKLGLQNAGTSIPDYLDRREMATSLQNLAIYTAGLRTFGGDNSPQEVTVVRASPSLFRVLGIAPQLGRVFTEQEDKPGKARVAVLGYGFWRTRLGARVNVIGEDIHLNGQRFRVVGVMPKPFGFPSRDVDVYVPYVFTAEQMSDRERGHEFSGSIGRLRPGATVQGLDADMDRIVRRNVAQGRIGGKLVAVSGFTGRAQLLRDTFVGDLKRTMFLLQALVLAVLLIACANVSNLQLARMATRRREMSVRAALGANRGRLARLVLIESLLLGIVGGGSGLLLAYPGLELVRALGLDRAGQGLQFGLDAKVLGFTLCSALLATLLSGLLPLFALLRDNLVRNVRGSGRASEGMRAAHSLRSALVVVQFTVSLMLLVGAGLLTKSFYELQQRGPGFDAQHVWTARIALPRERYTSERSRAQFEKRALEQLGALPGVSAAGYTSLLPLTGEINQGSVDIDGYTPPEGTAPPHLRQRSISEGYFASLGLRLIKGRNFKANESDRVVIVDKYTADKYWPGGGAVGQRLRRAVTYFPGARWYTVIGVVPAIKHTSLAEDPTQGTMYWYYQQRPQATGALTLRSSLPSGQITPAVTRLIHDIDPNLALFDVRPMNARLGQSLAPQRTPMVLTLIFAALAFTLAVVGIYGVLTWAVTQRFGEIGVRMALGAQGRDVVGMILKQGGRLIAIGVVLGVAGALALGRVMSSLIYEVGAADPVVFAIAAGGLSAAALLASWLPARRAARIDPMQALREE